jgi:hypothetical protein
MLDRPCHQHAPAPIARAPFGDHSEEVESSLVPLINGLGGAARFNDQEEPTCRI